MNTRYYDPAVGRFINADDISYLDPETINGLNLYAYCVNNPVMFVDPNGTDWWNPATWNWGKIGAWLLISVLAIVAGVGLVAGTLMIGGLLGAVIAGASIGFISGAYNSLSKQGGFNNLGNVNPIELLISGAIGAAIGAVAGVFSYGLGLVGQSVGTALGFNLSAMTIGSLQVGHVFSTEILMAVGGKIGSIIGGFLGSAFGDLIINHLTGNSSYNLDFIKGVLKGEYIGWFADFIKSLIF